MVDTDSKETIESAAGSQLRRRKVNQSSKDAPREDSSKKETKVGKADDKNKSGASALATIFNLTKNILGTGVLSLSSGSQGTGTIPAIAVLTIMAVLSTIMFIAIGKSCAATGQTTYKGVGVAAVSHSFASLVNLVCVSKTFLTSLMNSIVIGSSLSQIASSFSITVTPPQALVVITSIALLPMCLLRDLSGLKPFSIVGTFGIVYTLGFMIVRLFDGSYLEGGEFRNSIKYGPQFDAGGVPLWGTCPKTYILTAMSSIAFLAHYNAPRFYSELGDRSKFPFVVSVSFASALLISIGCLFVGSATFGRASQSNILVNYSAVDPLAAFARVAVGGSIVCSYPLVFAGLRDGLMELLSISSGMRTVLTLVLLTTITGAAMVVDDIGFISSITGAIYGPLLVYIFPTIIYTCSIRKSRPVKSSRVASAPMWLGACFMILFGIALGTYGTLAVLFPLA